MINIIEQKIKKAVGGKIAVQVMPAEKEEFGHYTTNVAFKLAGTLKKKPFEIAKELAQKLMDNDFESVEAREPGFINFRLRPRILQEELKTILKQKNKYGESKVKSRKLKVNVEFVSANPTGPLTMANGRGGFFGDVLANVLEKSGQKVTREYYINDAGNQVRLLGESIQAASGKIPKEDEHYKGGYIKKLKGKTPQQAIVVLLKEIQDSLKKSGIIHDVWFSEEKNLRKKKALEKVIELLRKKGLVEEKDGAMWLKRIHKAFVRPSVMADGLGLGDVLIKSDGQPTYFLADVAYHYDKFIKRKFDTAIDIWGADHHGYIARMKHGVQAIGVDPKRLQIIIMQLVRLISGGKEVKMSKRTGEFITLDELIKEVGADATRFFFLMHAPETHMDFDMDLAKERSQKNPVYYAQYAYVRTANILVKSEKSLAGQAKVKSNLSVLQSSAEIRLMQELSKFPDIVAQTAKDYQVHRLTTYALELGRALHNFYEKERVVGVGGKQESARVSLVSATKIVFENLFNLLGISKPSKM
ncbi:MAG: arginine--tRNA ligase [bacterium]|nr:arginine--tRNA ligase [bacterium]